MTLSVVAGVVFASSVGALAATSVVQGAAGVGAAGVGGFAGAGGVVGAGGKQVAIETGKNLL